METAESPKRRMNQIRNDAKKLGEVIRRNDLQEDPYYRSRLCDLRCKILRNQLKQK